MAGEEPEEMMTEEKEEDHLEGLLKIVRATATFVAFLSPRRRNAKRDANHRNSFDTNRGHNNAV